MGHHHILETSRSKRLSRSMRLFDPLTLNPKPFFPRTPACAWEATLASTHDQGKGLVETPQQGDVTLHVGQQESAKPTPEPPWERMAVTAPGLILVKRTSEMILQLWMPLRAATRLCSCRTRTDQVRASQVWPRAPTPSKRMEQTPGLR